MYRMPNAFTEYACDKITEMIRKAGKEEAENIFINMGFDMEAYKEEGTFNINATLLSRFIEGEVLDDVHNHQLCTYILYEIDIFEMEEKVEELVERWATKFDQDFTSPKRRCHSVCEDRCTCPRTFTR